jgi:O-antigen/teichoic acid export membrane protein
LRIDERLRADFSWVLGGNIIYSACQWCIVILLAKLGSPEDVGLYALGMAVAAPIILFANLQVRTLLASDVNGEFRFGQYLAFRFVSLGLALLAIVCVAAWTGSDWRHRCIIALVGFAQTLETLSDTYYGLMQKYDRMDRMSRSLMMKGPLALALLWITMYRTRNVLWAVLALAAGRLLILLVRDSRLSFARRVDSRLAARLEWNNNDMFRFFRLALPLGIISLLASLNGNIPRYFIEGHRGTAELGIYSAIASLLTAGTLIVSAFGQSIMVPAARAAADGDRPRYRSFIFQTLLLGAVLGSGALLVASIGGRFLLTHIFRPEYGNHADIFVWLMGAGIVLFMTDGIGYVMTAARALKPQVPLLLINCTVTALGCGWFIPRHGLRGAAEAIAVASVVQLAGCAIILWRIDRRLAPDSLILEAEPTNAGVTI